MEEKTIERAKKEGYYVTLIFFWLESVELAKDRVIKRVSEGGHGIAPMVIERRYKAGIKIFLIYIAIKWSPYSFMITPRSIQN